MWLDLEIIKDFLVMPFICSAFVLPEHYPEMLIVFPKVKETDGFIKFKLVIYEALSLFWPLSQYFTCIHSVLTTPSPHSAGKEPRVQGSWVTCVGGLHN
jgi:hypothetical protein